MNNWKKTTALLTASAMAAGLAIQTSAPVMAQSTGMLPIRAKIGVLTPSGSGKDFSGSTHFSGEVELLLPKLFPGKGKTGINVGFSRGSRGGNTLQVVPVTIERLFSPPNPVGSVTGNIYGGVGIGPYFVRASGNGTSASKTTLGGFGVVGYQLPNKYFVEAKYHLAGKVNGINPGGLALMVGRSF